MLAFPRTCTRYARTPPPCSCFMDNSSVTRTVAAMSITARAFMASRAAVSDLVAMSGSVWNRLASKTGSQQATGFGHRHGCSPTFKHIPPPEESGPLLLCGTPSYMGPVHFGRSLFGLDWVGVCLMQLHESQGHCTCLTLFNCAAPSVFTRNRHGHCAGLLWHQTRVSWRDSRQVGVRGLQGLPNYRSIQIHEENTPRSVKRCIWL